MAIKCRYRPRPSVLGGGVAVLALWGVFEAARAQFAYASALWGTAEDWRFLDPEHVLTIVLLGWLLFRAQDLGTLGAFTQGVLALRPGMVLNPAVLLVLALAVAAHLSSRDWLDRVARRFLSLPVPIQGAAYAGLLLVFCGLSAGGPSFIYFQF